MIRFIKRHWYALYYTVYDRWHFDIGAFDKATYNLNLDVYDSTYK